MKIEPYFQTDDFTLYKGDCREVLPELGRADLIFADPPYFLDKADWDKSMSREEAYAFNESWIVPCIKKLKEYGSIWITSTHHNAFAITDILEKHDCKVLNVIVWEKPSGFAQHPDLNFTNAVEYAIWATKGDGQFFNAELMKKLNGGKQLSNVWSLPSVNQWEVTCGRQVGQKPLSLLSRIILATTNEGDTVLDCFSGSGTTGIASNLFNRKYVGIEKEKKSLELSKARRLEINNETIRKSYISRVLEAIATDADWKDVVSEMSKYKIEAYSKKARIQKYSRGYFQENKEAIYERRKAKGKPSNQNAIWASATFKYKNQVCFYDGQYLPFINLKTKLKDTNECKKYLLPKAEQTCLCIYEGVEYEFWQLCHILRVERKMVDWAEVALNSVIK